MQSDRPRAGVPLRRGVRWAAEHPPALGDLSATVRTKGCRSADRPIQQETDMRKRARLPQPKKHPHSNIRSSPASLEIVPRWWWEPVCPKRWRSPSKNSEPAARFLLVCTLHYTQGLLQRAETEQQRFPCRRSRHLARETKEDRSWSCGGTPGGG